MPGLNPFNIQAMTTNLGNDFVTKDKEAIRPEPKKMTKDDPSAYFKKVKNGQKRKR